MNRCIYHEQVYLSEREEAKVLLAKEERVVETFWEKIHRMIHVKPDTVFPLTMKPSFV